VRCGNIEQEIPRIIFWFHTKQKSSQKGLLFVPLKVRYAEAFDWSEIGEGLKKKLNIEDCDKERSV
jgi:hypothetical protein